MYLRTSYCSSFVNSPKAGRQQFSTPFSYTRLCETNSFPTPRSEFKKFRTPLPTPYPQISRFEWSGSKIGRTEEKIDMAPNGIPTRISASLATLAALAVRANLKYRDEGRRRGCFVSGEIVESSYYESHRCLKHD